jgi:plasmid maintenance system antidote protein VapI
MIVLQNNLKNYIKESGITQEWLALKLGVHRITISRMCNKDTISLEMVQNIMNLTGEKDLTKIVSVISSDYQLEQR